MKYTEKTCREFVAYLGSKNPVPGGGSAAALAGALGASLESMVGELTLGKEKYRDVWEELEQGISEAREISDQLMELAEKDIEIFEPLSKLYAMKAVTEEEKAHKEQLLEDALYGASQVPMGIMEQCGRAIELSRLFWKKGVKMAVSDAGSGAIMCKSALQAAGLNVYINTRMMKNRSVAQELNDKCAMYMMKYTSLAEEIFQGVMEELRG